MFTVIDNIRNRRFEVSDHKAAMQEVRAAAAFLSATTGNGSVRCFSNETSIIINADADINRETKSSRTAFGHA